MSIRENIAYGVEDVSDDTMQKTCEEACAWDFIDEKPDKLMTDLTTGGSNLSGGQKQRLAIARAMIRRPDIILLDEATSALDVQNEAIVQKALNKLAKQGSALVIAHRLSTICDSNNIVVVDKGVDSEHGTHDELLKKHNEADESPTNGTNGHASPTKGAPVGMCLTRAMSTPSDSVPTDSKPARARSSSPGSKTASNADKGATSKKTTYRGLWEAGKKGADETMTLKQIEEKMSALIEELAALEARSSVIKEHVSDALPERAEK